MSRRKSIENSGSQKFYLLAKFDLFSSSCSFYSFELGLVGWDFLRGSVVLTLFLSFISFYVFVNFGELLRTYYCDCAVLLVYFFIS